MNIAFFGTPDFTTDFLDILTNEGYQPNLVVTGPDVPVGRGMKLTAPKPKLWGEHHHVTVLQPPTLTEAVIDQIASQPWDLFIVIAYGKIIPERLINIPTYGTINVHYSLLPKYRGASPVESALLNGDTQTGVCIQHMRYKLDTGPIIAAQTVPIEPNDNTPTLRQKLNNVALTMLPVVIEALKDGTATFTEQDEAHASMTKKFSKELGNLDLVQRDIEKWRIFQSIGDRGWVRTTVQKNNTVISLKITQAILQDGVFIIKEVIPPNSTRQPLETFLRT